MCWLPVITKYRVLFGFGKLGVIAYQCITVELHSYLWLLLLFFGFVFYWPSFAIGGPHLQTGVSKTFENYRIG